MTVAPALAAAPRAPSRRRPSSRVGRAIGRWATGAGVFCAVIGGYVGFVHWQIDSSPLPGTEGRQGPCALWFVGSSTIFRWSTLDRDMAPWTAHNRGIGGALLPYVVRRFGNEQGTPAPGAIVFYGGENDIAAGASAADAAGAFARFLDAKTRAYGATPVIAVSLKPSPTRWANLAEQARFNTIVRGIAARRSDVRYVDVVGRMLVGGRPGPFYLEDGVHMTPAGYARWTPLVRHALVAALPPGSAERCGAAS